MAEEQNFVISSVVAGICSLGIWTQIGLLRSIICTKLFLWMEEFIKIRDCKFFYVLCPRS
jgi:hypothetical protein